jgi:hypothetical protein
MTSEIRTGSLGGNPSTEKTAKNLDLAASEITAIQDLRIGTVVAVTATGSIQGDAAALSVGFNLVADANGTKGVLLPVAAAGKQVRIKNNVNAQLKIWPASDDAINALGANNSMTIAAWTTVTLEAYDGTTWYTFPLLPS